MELDSIAIERGPTAGDGANERGLGTKKGVLTESPNGTNTQDIVTPDVTEYPSAVKRTAIVVGVALALFCVRRRQSATHHRGRTSLTSVSFI